MKWSQHLSKMHSGRSKNYCILLTPLFYKHWVYLNLYSKITPKIGFSTLFLSLLFHFHLLWHLLFILLLLAIFYSCLGPPTRLGSFQSIYCIVFSKYFPNRIYVKTFKHSFLSVSEFSFNYLRDLFQGIELSSGEPVFPTCYWYKGLSGCNICIDGAVLFLKPFSFIIKWCLSFTLITFSFKRTGGHLG